MDVITQDLAEVKPDRMKVDDVSHLCTIRHLDGVMSFDPKTQEGATMLIKAELLEQKELRELVNMPIKVVHIFAKPITDTDEYGEISGYVRIVIFDESGEAYSCGSRGVLKSLSVLNAIRGPMPWYPPVVCTVKMRTLDNKQNWMTLEPDLKLLFPDHHQIPKRAQDKR